MPFEKGHSANPTGKGGFSDNPENRSSGRWSKETSISYLQNKFGRMDINEFEKYEPKTRFEQAAYNSIKESTADLSYLKEVTDRTEGKPINTTEISGKDGKDISIAPVQFIVTDDTQ